LPLNTNTTAKGGSSTQRSTNSNVASNPRSNLTNNTKTLLSSSRLGTNKTPLTTTKRL
jgi:hypothetical protein